MKRTSSILGGLAGLLVLACVISCSSSEDTGAAGGAAGSSTGGAAGSTGGAAGATGGAAGSTGGATGGTGGGTGGTGGGTGGTGGGTGGTGGGTGGTGGGTGGTGGGTGGTGGLEGGTAGAGGTGGSTDGGGFNVAAWKAGCNGTAMSITSGRWFAGADSYQGTSTLTSPCAPTTPFRCEAAVMTCSTGGRGGSNSVHLTGNKAKGSSYVGFTFGDPATPTPTGSKGISFWYKSSGTAFAGGVQIDLGLTDDILVADWQAPGPGTCLAPGYDYNLNQCWNNPLKNLPAAADWTQVTILWSEFTIRPYQTAMPAWWDIAKAAMDTHIIFARIGVLGDTDRASDAGTPPAVANGTIDIWIDSVTLIP